MNLEEKKAMLENIINEISIKGHDEQLLQQLIRCYFDIYLAEGYQELGTYIDAFCSTREDLDSDFFGQIIKTAECSNPEDKGIGKGLVNGFRVRLVYTVIKANEALKKIYTDLGVLEDNSKKAEFWWNNVVNALTDFDFKDLCQIAPNKNLTNGRLLIYFICEKDLRTLLMEKGIPEESYSISYGNLYGGAVFVVGSRVDDMFRKEFEQQRQKGLYIKNKMI